MTTAPWWGVPVIAGGFLILGGLLTFLYTYFNDRRKSRETDLRRWENDVLDAAISIVARTTAVAMGAESERDVLAADQKAGSIPWSSHTQGKFKEKHQELLVRFEMVAPPELSYRADQLILAAVEHLRYVNIDESTDKELGAWRAARGNFSNSVRAELRTRRRVTRKAIDEIVSEQFD